MSEFIGEPVEVRVGPGPGAPASFTWQGRSLGVVEVVEAWQDYGF